MNNESILAFPFAQSTPVALADARPPGIAGKCRKIQCGVPAACIEPSLARGGPRPPDRERRDESCSRCALPDSSAGQVNESIDECSTRHEAVTRDDEFQMRCEVIVCVLILWHVRETTIFPLAEVARINGLLFPTYCAATA
jgi:hypothetical protein